MPHRKRTITHNLALGLGTYATSKHSGCCWIWALRQRGQRRGAGQTFSFFVGLSSVKPPTLHHRRLSVSVHAVCSPSFPWPSFVFILSVADIPAGVTLVLLSPPPPPWRALYIVNSVCVLLLRLSLVVGVVQINVILREEYSLSSDVAKHLVSNYGNRALQVRASIVQCCPTRFCLVHVHKLTKVCENMVCVVSTRKMRAQWPTQKNTRGKLPKTVLRTCAFHSSSPPPLPPRTFACGLTAPTMIIFSPNDGGKTIQNLIRNKSNQMRSDRRDCEAQQGIRSLDRGGSLPGHQVPFPGSGGGLCRGAGPSCVFVGAVYVNVVVAHQGIYGDAAGVSNDAVFSLVLFWRCCVAVGDVVFSLGLE